MNGRKPRPSREPKPHAFLAFGLNEMPSRIAIFLIDAGFRPVTFAASSKDFEARANSIKRRCSANDQPNFRAIKTKSFAIRAKAPNELSLDAFAVVGPDFGNLSGSPSIFDLRKLATNAAR
jgi:hypothetical protein